MSKKVIKGAPQRFCGECALGKWVESHANIDMQGKPIMLTCKNEPFNVLRSQKACNSFKSK